MSLVRRYDTHRLIASKYGEASGLARIADDEAHLAEIGRFRDEVTFDDYLSDFSAAFHDLRQPGAFRDCLDPDSYPQSQALAEQLHAAGSLGVVYPSVRRPAISIVRRG